MRDKILKIGLLSCLLMASGMMEAKAEDRISEGMMADSEEKKTGMADSEDTDSLTRYDRRIIRYRKHWDVLMPTQSVVQTCGNMGIISVVSARITERGVSGKRICSSASSRNTTRMP